MEIVCHLIKSGASIPCKAQVDDAGFDLYLQSDVLLDSHLTTIPLGIILEIPVGYYGQILGRSSVFKNGIYIHPGVIDSGYRGEIIIIAENITGCKYDSNAYYEPKTYRQGNRLAQLLVLPVPDVQIVKADGIGVSETARGANGFGSTGA